MRAAPALPVPRSTRSVTSLPLQVLGRLRRALVERPAAGEQLDVADLDPRAIEVEVDAGAPGDRDEPSPVRVGAVHRGLHQRRVGDRPRRALGFDVGGGRRSPRW